MIGAGKPRPYMYLFVNKGRDNPTPICINSSIKGGITLPLHVLIRQ
jgi:hypothetical protein